MNDRNVDKLLNAWMDLGPTTAPDRIAEAARLEVRSTPQTATVRWWPPRRLPQMNTFAKLGLAAAAIAVAVALGLNALLAPSIGDPIPPTPTQSAAPFPTSSDAAPSPSAATAPRWSVSPTAFPVRIEVRLPGAWKDFADATGFWAWVRNGLSRTEVGFYVVDNLYADPCRPDLGWRDPPIGSTAEDLVSELTRLPAFEGSTVSEVTFGGHSATHIVAPIARGDVGLNACDDPEVYNGVGTSARDAVVGLLALGQYRTVWIVDVDGERLLVVAEDHAAKAAELDAVIESVRIESR